MRRRWRQIGVALFSGTIISLVLLQTSLMKQSIVQDERISMLKRSMLANERASGPIIAIFEGYGQFGDDSDEKYRDELISDYNHKRALDRAEYVTENPDTDVSVSTY